MAYLSMSVHGSQGATFLLTRHRQRGTAASLRDSVTRIFTSKAIKTERALTLFRMREHSHIKYEFNNM